MASPPGAACPLEGGIILRLSSGRAWPEIWEPGAGLEHRLVERLLNV